MKTYTHIFFDLDHTLWDYDTNSEKVLRDLYEEFELHRLLLASVDGFLSTFYKVNASMWNRFNAGEIHRDDIRDDRFDHVIKGCGGRPESGLGSQMSTYFLHHCPRQTAVMEDADVILPYLHQKYQMSIVTNGFDDVQSVKLKSANLARYFDHVFTSETIGFRKPSPEIFDHAIEVTGANRTQVLMIGDNPKTDVLGAQNAGITPLLYDPIGRAKSNCELRISALGELMKLL